MGRRRRHPPERQPPVSDAPIRVVVADDQEIVRTGLRMILDAQPGIAVVAE
ncbi:MAG: DNA-binding response regulator, partial [Jiangellaceae bacterium]